MSGQEKNPEQTAAFVTAVAAKQGWVSNPDQPFRMRIEEGLAKNHQRYGYFLCPCRDGDGDRAMDRDIICPCAYAKPDIAEFGHCFCGLFLAPALAKAGSPPQAIPERRNGQA